MRNLNNFQAAALNTTEQANINGQFGGFDSFLQNIFSSTSSEQAANVATSYINNVGGLNGFLNEAQGWANSNVPEAAKGYVGQGFDLARTHTSNISTSQLNSSIVSAGSLFKGWA